MSLAVSSTRDSQDTENIEYVVSQAIKAALSTEWESAVKFNKKILEAIPDDIESLNRLARAYTCLGQKNRAQQAYDKVLSIDPYNIIAKKNIEKLSKMNGHTNGNGHTVNLSGIFLYEPGKTKIINLLNLAPPSILATISCGEKLLLSHKKHTVQVSTLDGTYLGALPDDLSYRLITLIVAGNKYEAYVKAVTVKNLTIFIREIERCAKFAMQPSFSDNKYFFDDKELT